MIAGVPADRQGSRDALRDELFRCSHRCTDDDFDSVFGKECLRALAHAAGDDAIDAPFREPRWEQPRLVRRRLDILADHHGLAFRIDVEQGEAGAVAEMDGEFAVSEGDGETHDQAP